MKPTIKHFSGGILCVALGLFARSLYGAARPGDNFLIHPLATDSSGVAVELIGWIGILGWILIGTGLTLVMLSVGFGLKTGKIQSFIEGAMPKRKAPPAEEAEEENDE